MQIIRYQSSAGIGLGIAHNDQLIGSFQPGAALHDLLRLRTDELRAQIENSIQPEQLTISLLSCWRQSMVKPKSGPPV